MARFFLSYRRDDSAGFAGRLADALEARFGAGSVFRDVDDIAPGEDFVQALDRHLREVDAVLVVIGPRWINDTRLHDSADFVRREIENALAFDKPLLPLLVGGATMPAQQVLPESLHALARKQAMTLSDADWKRNVEDLALVLNSRKPAALTKAGTERRFVLALAGAAAIILAGIASGVYLSQETPYEVAGRWSAEVRYEWGDTHREIFEFQTKGKEVLGTASHLGRVTSIGQASFDGRRLSFIIRGEEMMGGDRPWKEVIHRYTGEVAEDGIHFTLESSGGYTQHDPLQFVAKRMPAEAGGK